ncbi:two-component response regulator ARR18-like [Solanum lycopersicum]|uniref:two-component response regulator ARR18-like n=1 Tax=Solanum lycopersicum TaxID=4081 RepID=UPI00374A0235
MASQGMSMLLKGKEKIDLMIINMNSPDLLSFQLLDQAVVSDIVPICVCNEYDARSAKKAFKSGAYFYMQKPVDQGIVKHMWQLVLQKNIQKEKVIDVIDNNTIVKELYVDKSNASIDIDEQDNDIHETKNDVGTNEKSKLKRKRGKKLIEEDKSQSSVTKVIIRRKTRIVWTEDLHDKFQKAVNKLNDGRCFPTYILEAMNVPGLTRYQVASHLQKCRNNTWKAPRKRKSTCDSSSQLGISSDSSVGIFETTSHLKMNVTNLQQQQIQRGLETPFQSNINIFSRGESSNLQKPYHQQLQVDPQYLNPFYTSLASSAENNNLAGLQQQQQQEPLSELWRLQGSNIGSADYTHELEFNNEIHHAQNDYALDLEAYARTMNGLGVENIDFQKRIGEQNMAQPTNNVITTLHKSDTQGSELSEMMDSDAYFDSDDLDFLFLNDESPIFDLPNEHDSASNQVYFNNMATSSAQFPEITSFLDDSST